MFTIEQRVFLLKRWWITDKDYAQVVLDFEEKFANVAAPTRQYLWKLSKKFDATGSVCNASRSGRSKTVRAEDNLLVVAQTFLENPRQSQRKVSLELNISRSSLQRILKRLNFKPYRPRLLHALHEDDYDRRVQFCEMMLIRIEAEPQFCSRILWTDEATFKLNGRVNRHNSIYWSDENPHEVISQELNVPGVCVWGGIWFGGLIGPYFFEDTVTGDSYLNMLRETIIPELQNSPLFEGTEIIWQQDGAPPHFANVVREFLEATFVEWIGRRGTWDWPPRSCDLTPCDFSMWGIIKDIVFSEKPTNIDHLKLLIENAFEHIDNDKELIRRICSSVEDRCRAYIEHEGHHFENYR